MGFNIPYIIGHIADNVDFIYNLWTVLACFYISNKHNFLT